MTVRRRSAPRHAARPADCSLLARRGARAPVVWSFVVPVFEAPDEYLHWQYARYLHDTRQLPIYGPASPKRIRRRSTTRWSRPSPTTALPPPVDLGRRGTTQLVDPVRAALFHEHRRRLRALLADPRGAPADGADVSGHRVVVLRARRCAMARAARRCSAPASSRSCRNSPFAAQVSNDALVTTMAAATVSCMVRMMTHAVHAAARRRHGGGVGGGLSRQDQRDLSRRPGGAGVVMERGAGAATAASCRRRPGACRDHRRPWSMRNIVLYGDPFASAAMHDAVGRARSAPWPRHTSGRRSRDVDAIVRRLLRLMNVRLPMATIRCYWALGLVGLASVAQQTIAGRRCVRLALVIAAIVGTELAWSYTSTEVRSAAGPLHVRRAAGAGVADGDGARRLPGPHQRHSGSHRRRRRPRGAQRRHSRRTSSPFTIRR